MKTLTKIFMAVVALFAVSCVTDTTEDLGVNLGEGQTTISISLEESRTHLGEKVGEGEDAQYPLYWSEGDQIAVNGKASNALPKSAHGQQSATFTLNGAIGFPRTIVYPAPAEGVVAETAGQYPVTFLATQEYIEGTFAEGAAPMYAYQASSDDAVALQHLSGVLSIAPYGEGVTLRKMTITAESGKLAGNFDVAADGTLTAHADASNTITVTFGEGLTLGATEADAKPIYVALPGGEFDMVSVKLYSESGMMSRSINTASKPITAGKVRVFPPLEFVSNDEEGTFYIYDEASLRNFATNIASVKKAYLIADVDMTDESWTSVSATNGFVLDGQNHMIKGLTAPMFNELKTNPVIIKNLHLNVNIDSNATKVGGLANYYACESKKAGAEGLTNVTVSGSVKGGASTTHIGGIIGHSLCSSYLNTHNYASVTLTGNHTVNSSIFVGGCVGYLEGGSSGGPFATIDNCKNSGTVTIDKDCKVAKLLYIGGISGATAYYPGLQTNNIVATNLENSGNIEIYGETAGDRMFLGGIIGLLQHQRDFSGLKNSGKITVKSGAKLKNTHASNGSAIGGIVGVANNTSANISNLTSTAEASITIEDGVEVNATSPYRIGGCVAIIGAKFNNLENNGAITIGAQIKDLYCGGVAGQVGSIAPTGYFTNNGAVEVSNTTTSQNLYVGGAAGWVSVANTNNFCNYGNIKVDATTENNNIIVGGATAKSDKVFSNAKVFCDIEAPGYESVGMVMGTSRTDDVYTSNCAVGGSIQRGSADKENLSLNNYTTYAYSNEVGDALVVNSDKCGWLASKDAEPKYKFIAGLTISNADELQAFAEQVKLDSAMAKNVELTTNIDMSEVEWTPIEGYAGTFDGKEFEISGLTAPLFGTTQASLQNIKLTNVNIAEATGVNFGALACNIDNETATVENCSVSGTIDLEYTTEIATAELYIGGLVGYTTSNKVFSGLKNEASIAVSGTGLAQKVNVGGCVASIASGTIANSTNLGAINCTSDSTQNTYIGGVTRNAKYVELCTNGKEGDKEVGTLTFNPTNASSAFLLGGVAESCSTSIKSSNNYANITTGGSTGEGQIAGVVRAALNCEFSDCTNAGDITFGSTASARVMIGGVIWCATTSKFKNCHNKGAITATEGSSTTGTYAVGGIVSYSNSNYANVTLDGCSNSGDIEIKGSCATADGAMLNIGGAIGYYTDGDTTTTDNQHITFTNGFTNSGNISVDVNVNGKQSNIGGLLGYLQHHIVTLSGNVVNTGAITIGGENDYDNLSVGGLIGDASNSTITFNDASSNRGTITIDVVKAGVIYVGGLIGDGSADAKLTNAEFTNSAALSVAATSSGQIKFGGVVGYMKKTGSSCTWTCNGNVTNSGALSISGKGDGTSTFGNVMYAGIVGNLWSDTQVYLNNAVLTNSGSVTYAGGECKAYSKQVQMGGLGGNHQKAFVCTGNCKIVNSGKISATIYKNGTNITRLDLGGIYGVATTPNETIALENTGEIYCVGDSGNSGNYGVGGIAGWASNAITNARCFCKITVLNEALVGHYGFIMGNPYSETTLATNCHIGGSIPSEDGGERVKIEDYDFYKYIYGDRDRQPEDIRLTNCGWLNESINDTPIDVDGNKIE